MRILPLFTWSRRKEADRSHKHVIADAAVEGRRCGSEEYNKYSCAFLITTANHSYIGPAFPYHSLAGLQYGKEGEWG